MLLGTIQATQSLQLSTMLVSLTLQQRLECMHNMLTAALSRHLPNQQAGKTDCTGAEPSHRPQQYGRLGRPSPPCKADCAQSLSICNAAGQLKATSSIACSWLLYLVKAVTHAGSLCRMASGVLPGSPS